MKHKFASAVEKFDPLNPFHQHVLKLVTVRGRGEPLALVWSSSNYALRGMCVTQLQYGMRSYNFDVQCHSNGYTLSMLAQQSSCISDYFKGVWQP